MAEYIQGGVIRQPSVCAWFHRSPSKTRILTVTIFPEAGVIIVPVAAGDNTSSSYCCQTWRLRGIKLNDVPPHLAEGTGCYLCQFDSGDTSLPNYEPLRLSQPASSVCAHSWIIHGKPSRHLTAGSPGALYPGKNCRLTAHLCLLIKTGALVIKVVP